jgi:hypothetical protein
LGDAGTDCAIVGRSTTIRGALMAMSQGVRPLCQRNRSPGNLEFLAAELESNTTEV